MNWDAMGAVGEVAGAIAVFATLLYLAIQIRQSNRAATTQTYDSIISGFNDVNMVVASVPGMAEVLNTGLYHPEKLTEEQAIQFAFLLRSFANQWLKLLRLYEQGVLAEAEWGRFGAEAAQAFHSPGGKIFRKENGVFHDLYVAIDQFDGSQITEIQLGLTNKA